MDPSMTAVGVDAAPNPILFVFWLAVVVLMVVATWIVYVKAGKPGWGSIIPFYNAYLWLKIAGMSGWLLILLFIPIANLVVYIVTCVKVAGCFGKGGGYAVGMILLPIVFIPILAFGEAVYSAPDEAM
jgi:hypothetical protein